MGRHSSTSSRAWPAPASRGRRGAPRGCSRGDAAAKAAPDVARVRQEEEVQATAATAALVGSRSSSCAAGEDPATALEFGGVEGSRWERYPSLNDVDLEQVEKIRSAVRGTGAEFVALEKVHGSNFAFETDGRAVAYFSRNRGLEAQERFVGKTAPAEAMGRYHGPVRQAFRLCSGAAAGGDGTLRPKSVIIYGEYFGGWYPHEEVKQEGPGAGAPVQKGIVAYAPGHHFFAFDVCIDGAFLDYDAARDLLQRAGFPLVASPIVRGTFDDCMRFDVDSFHTTIPGLLGLPPCQGFSTAEGLVIRPVRRSEAWTVKRKSVQYLEACPNELRKWLNRCVENKAEAFAGLYLSLCQLPRLEAVLSKEPQLRTAKALRRVQELFREDVQEAFEQKLTRIHVSKPPSHFCEAARAEADRRVAAWLLGAVAGGA